MRPWIALLSTLTSACSTDANHLGNPLTWPATLVASTLSNAVYDARRTKVAAFVKAHGPDILAQAKAGTGPMLTQAFDTAQVPPARRDALTLELARNDLYRANSEALVVALMVHAG
jgi:hypothetical protein